MIRGESKTLAPKNLSQDWPFGEWSAKKTSTGDPNTGTGAQARKALILWLPSLVSAMIWEDTPKPDKEKVRNTGYRRKIII